MQRFERYSQAPRQHKQTERNLEAAPVAILELGFEHIAGEEFPLGIFDANVRMAGVDPAAGEYDGARRHLARLLEDAFLGVGGDDVERALRGSICHPAV
ncbi:hypothetical protein [Methylobacterium sp. WL8]|uniref:hypothetical protein n=1 Tax=Methylobacterium sp. WL8 TaxID=2603899 RepID=UPI0016504448|nr:hypothetical protein [Methylobacterium sp. WL8]